MTGRSPQHGQETEWFTAPGQVNQRRYEALRAYFVDGLTYEQAGAGFGYTRWAMVDLVRQHRAGKLELFAAPKKPGPPPGAAPAKERVRGRVIELRRQGYSTYEISGRLAAEGTPLNRTSVGEILAEEGFGRLLRHPEPEASISPATAGRDTNLPAATVIDFTAWPGRAETTRAGLLLAIPDLVSLDLPALAAAAGYPGTRVIPAVNWLLSLLALKLTRTRRVSHVDDLLTDPAAALFAGMAVLPKKSALTAYSYRLSHDHQQKFLAALDKQMIAGGLATAGEAIFDLDFHAIMHWGADPVLEKHYVPSRSQRARSVLTFFAQDTGTHNLVYANADVSKASQAREAIAFCDHWKGLRGRPEDADHGPEGHHPGDPRRTGRTRRQVRHLADAVSLADEVHQQPGPGRLHHDHPGPARPAQQAEGPRGPRREADQLPRNRPPADRHRPGTREPTVIITNDDQIKTRALVSQYARRMTIEQRLAEIIRAFCADALSSTVNLNVDLDVMLAVLACALTAAIRARLPGYTAATPDTIQRRFLETPGQIIHDRDTITVRLDRRAFSPVLRKADLPADTPVPWWAGRTIRYELA